ncbi:mitochondrial import inner membrane translocase subunit tim54 [Aspergillus campestris IBT 28561]|uniref:Mitochondrial import inner membrane translocase subunit TIM54 n=1 Tax=Aspergillus campestris (strain IBT 28561) TaxID=1392248 RepID=A0A2I1D5V8_ASPC2|nr:mitochondrial import inner membrane translocase subunit tim54 [Aspergillus campestris IBT 28561]PKY05248.1 mitochondrial import inner membrane translocase subunit tim54 [Aspergillus campestris IBT 28561]
MRMMGMPNFRFKLPSRNWMIFFSVTGSFTAALLYDRREKKRAQQKWCDLVAHLSKESLPIDQTRRKITVFLSAPPGDGIRNARDHFKQYVKPILVAAALDYNVIEGRREGDVRAGLAERIRKDRRSNGEPSSVVLEPGVEDVVADARQKIGVTEEPGPKGDLVIGRHTWKEYIRGLHEGWLGPLDPPPPPPSAVVEEPTVPETPVAKPSEESKKPEEPSEKKEEEKKEEKPKPTGPTPAYLAPADYSSQHLPASLPPTLAGSVPVPFPHILGFLNTPIRIWRYLNQRSLADHVGREVAGLVLASYSRPYVDGGANNTEQQTALEEEEKEWHKSVHRTDEANPDREREWLNDIVLDPRIASRMHRYTVSPDEEARSHRLLAGEEYILGEERPAPVSFWQHLWIKYGYGEDAETLKRKVILGDLDSEDSQ